MHASVMVVVPDFLVLRMVGMIEVVGPVVFRILDITQKEWARVTIIEGVRFRMEDATRLSVWGNVSLDGLPSASVVVILT